ncbi:MAG: hypothetical protein ACOX6J_03195 [Oscillospiraceae bacterium]|jgi:hypothetical protein
MENRIKRYVEVDAIHFVDGSVRPRSIRFSDNKIYVINRLNKVIDRSADGSGRSGTCYMVQICGNETRLFEDGGRWYVEAKEEYGGRY